MEKRKGTRSLALSTPVITGQGEEEEPPKGPRRSEQGDRKKTNRGLSWKSKKRSQEGG